MGAGRPARRPLWGAGPFCIAKAECRTTPRVKKLTKGRALLRVNERRRRRRLPTLAYPSSPRLPLFPPRLLAQLTSDSPQAALARIPGQAE